MTSTVMWVSNTHRTRIWWDLWEHLGHKLHFRQAEQKSQAVVISYRLNQSCIRSNWFSTRENGIKEMIEYIDIYLILRRIVGLSLNKRMYSAHVDILTSTIKHRPAL